MFVVSMLEVSSGQELQKSRGPLRKPGRLGAKESPKNRKPKSAEPASSSQSLAQRRNHASILQNGSQGDRRRAMEVYQEIVADTKAKFGADKFPSGHQEVVNSLTDLAAAYGTINEYADAVETQREARQLCDGLYPQSEWPVGAVETAVCTVRLAQYHLSNGKMAEFERLLQEAVEILDVAKPVSSFEHAYARMEIGFLYIYNRKVGPARKQCLTAAHMASNLEQVPTHYKDNLAILYARCAWVFYKTLQLDEAKDYAKRALKLTESLPAAKVHHTKAQSLRCLANTCRDLGQYEEAVHYFDRATQMFQATGIDEAGTLAVETAYCHLQLGDLDLAGQWLDRAGKYVGAQSPIQTKYLVVRGHLQLLRGQDEDALETFQVALEMAQPQGADSRNVSQIHEGLGTLGLRRGNAPAAAKWFEKAWQQRADEFVRIMPAASEAYSLHFLSDYWDVSQNYLRATRTLNRPEQVADQYAIISRQRGLVGRVIAMRNRLLRSLDSDGDRLYRDYLTISNQLANHGLHDRSTLDQKAFSDLRVRRDYLGEQLAEQVPSLIESIRQLHVRIPTIQAAIGSHETLIDFVRYRSGKSLAYAVFVVSNETLHRLDIDDAESIEHMIHSWRSGIAEGQYNHKLARDLYSKLWKPIARLVPKNVTTINICADGPLCLMPWSALESDDGTILLENFVIAMPPCPQALVSRQNKKDAESGRLLVVGNIDYGMISGGAAAEQHARPVGGEIRSWRSLPHSEAEIQNVMMLAPLHLKNSKRLDGKSATASNVVSELSASRWVHIATHGFCNALEPSTAGNLGFRNPLNACGLVFAGANRVKPLDYNQARTQAGEADATLVNGAAICNLDLGRTELVFLSACDSGVGEVFDGEGIFGLPRAFHHAGADNVVCSLWPVDDAATAALVQKFYENYWANGRSAAQALRDAQLAIYRDPLAIERFAASRGGEFDPAIYLRSKSPTSPPRLWAGFVLSGSELVDAGTQLTDR